MDNAPAPWTLYLVGALMSLLLLMVGVPPLAFALGMYLPQELNTPLLLGGIVSWWVTTRSSDQKLNSARGQRGTLIASGFIAGGSLFGVINALIRFFGQDWYMADLAESNTGEFVGLIMFSLLCIYAVVDSMRAKPE